MIDFRSIHLDHQVILMDRRIQPGKFRLVTHIISYFFFNYIHYILVHCHSACFCNRHPFNLLLHCFLCIFIGIITDNIDLLWISYLNKQFHFSVKPLIYFYFFVCRLFGVSLLEFLVVIAFSYIFYKLSFWHWSCIIKSLYLIALDFS